MVPGVTAIVSPRMFASYRSQIGGLLRVMLVVLGLLLVLALVVTAALFAMAAHERRRELGVLRALGASRGAVLISLLGEALLLALAGGLAGALVAAAGVGLFHTLLVSALGFPFLFPAFGRLGRRARCWASPWPSPWSVRRPRCRPCASAGRIRPTRCASKAA